MSSDLLILIAMMAATVLVGLRLKVWWWPGRPGYEYQRVFTAAMGGLLFLVGGVIGYDLTHGTGPGDTRWTNQPIWWQIALGLAFLLLAGFWARRLSPLQERKA